MSQTNDPRPVYVRYREELKLLGVFLATFIPAVFVADMLVRGIEGSPTVASFGAIGDQLGLNELVLGTALLGVILATVVLLVLDYQKRVQAILLGFATVVALILMLLQFDSVASRIGLPEFVALLGGFLLGIVLLGRGKFQYIQIGDTSGTVSSRSVEARGQEPLTFPGAERALTYILGVIVVFGFFEAHTSYTQYMTVTGGSLVIQDPTQNFQLVGMTAELVTVDLVASGVFLGTATWFLGYESGRSVFVLGPSGSGKTHFSIATYLKSQELGLRPRNPTDELTRLVQRLIDEEDFIPERTREVHDLSFEYTTGKYFPKNVKLDAFDYPGEYLPHVPGGLEVLYDRLSQYDYEDQIREQVDEGVAVDQGKGLETGSDSSGMATDGGADEGVESDSAEAGGGPSAAISVGDEVIRERAKLMVNEVCPRVVRADLLVLVIDMERVLNDAPLGAEWYSDILARLPDDQEVIITVTKADLLMEGNTGMQEMMNPVQLRNNIDQTIRQHAGANRLPIAEKPYPVFYKTYEENGERHIQMQNPMTTATQPQQGVQKSPGLYGYEALLNRLGR
jgi:hypothetical protein